MFQGGGDTVAELTIIFNRTTIGERKQVTNPYKPVSVVLSLIQAEDLSRRRGRRSMRGEGLH